MSDLFDYSALVASSGIRMAYTLNNNQPVKCTLVSEEPLFYLDVVPTEIEEDISFDFADLDLINNLHTNIDDINTSMPEEITYNISSESISLFKEQFGNNKTFKNKSTLLECLEKIRTSRMGATLLDFIESQKVTILEADQMATIFYDRKNAQITVRQNLTTIEKTLLIVRELRRVWQQKKGALIHPLLFHPDHAILVNRLQAADLMTNLIRVAWEMKLAGDQTAWNYLEEKGYSDLTKTFSREALTDFRSLSSGHASAATFESWFMSERCRAFDRILIQQMLADYQTYVHSAGHIETSRVLSHQIISALGEMPYGNNYLSSHAMIILEDPIFTEIRDRSNANFLWFIKFEQSFKQTERDLHQGEQTSLSKDSSVNASTTATILSLPKIDADRSDLAKRHVQNGQTKIIDLQGWRARRLDTL